MNNNNNSNDKERRCGEGKLCHLLTSQSLGQWATYLKKHSHGSYYSFLLDRCPKAVKIIRIVEINLHLWKNGKNFILLQNWLQGGTMNNALCVDQGGPRRNLWLCDVWTPNPDGWNKFLGWESMDVSGKGKVRGRLGMENLHVLEDGLHAGFQVRQ